MPNRAGKASCKARPGYYQHLFPVLQQAVSVPNVVSPFICIVGEFVRKGIPHGRVRLLHQVGTCPNFVQQVGQDLSFVGQDQGVAIRRRKAGRNLAYMEQVLGLT